MIRILYEDESVIVVDKPAGMESQVSRGFAADVVSELKKHRKRELSTNLSTKAVQSRGQKGGKPLKIQGEPYIGVIHRLDKPVAGVMVYAKTPKAANALSEQVKRHQMEKIYHAVVCGKLGDKSGEYVDILLKDGKNNCSVIVDKEGGDAKRAELIYRVLDEREENGESYSLVEIRLLTGRHHQIRVQFSGHGHPLWGDSKYNPLWGGTAALSSGAAVASKQGNAPEEGCPRRGALALCAVSLTFFHPVTGERMTFTREAGGEAFSMFFQRPEE